MAPSVLYATEMVRDRRAVERLDKAWEKHLAAATLTGRANTWWSDEPLIRREGLRWHGSELPWGAQVRQRAAGLVGRLARPGRALAQQLLQKGGDVGGFLTTGLALVQESGCRLPLPTRKVRQGRWKGRVRNVLRREHALGAARARGRAGEDRSDCLMLATPHLTETHPPKVRPPTNRPPTHQPPRTPRDRTRRLRVLRKLSKAAPDEPPWASLQVLNFACMGGKCGWFPYCSRPAAASTGRGRLPYSTRSRYKEDDE